MDLIELNTDLIKEKIKKVLDELNTGLYEKERSIRLTLLAVLAGESTFMLGEPGTAKSLIARRISEALGIEKKDFFSYLMNQFSHPDEVFGPVSIQKLKCDEYERKTENYLPKAKFAFLDEIWKANPAIQNALLTILNEREFRNNGKTEKVDLIGFVSASNELPAEEQGLEAIFDRFLVRILERPVSKDSDSFRNMISDSEELPPVTEKLTLEEIKHIIAKSKDVKLSDECYEIIVRIAKVTSEQNETLEDEWLISDRRWKKIVNLMRVSAFCNGRTETNIMDASIIADCIWRNEDQEEEAKAILKEAIENYGLESNTNFNNLQQKLTQFEQRVTTTFFQEEVIQQGIKQTKTIDDYDFYVVRDSSNNIHKISINAYENYSYYDRYLYDGTSNTIYGNWDEDTFTEYHHDKKYTIVYTQPKKELVRKDFYSKEKSQGKIIVEDFNNRYYNSLYNELKNNLLSIEKEIESCITKYGDNLFANNNFYLSGITTKLASAKVEINELIAKLKKQKDRYDIY